MMEDYESTLPALPNLSDPANLHIVMTGVQMDKFTALCIQDGLSRTQMVNQLVQAELERRQQIAGALSSV